MNIVLFTTQERGPDHGDIYYMKTGASKATEISRQEYLALLDLPGEWREGDYYIASQTGENAHRRVVLAYGTQSATIDHEWHTCPDCLTCGGVCEACDYRQTMDASSSRGQ